MSNRQWSISKSKAMQEVASLAMQRWPDSRTEAQALARALMRWFYDQQGDSRKAVAERTDKRLETMDRKLDVLVERGSHDTDHG